MKLLYLGLGILAVLLALCIGSSVLLCRSTRESEAHLQEAAAALEADNFSAAANHAQQAKQAFDRRQELLSAFLSHEELDEIAIDFAELEVYGQEGSREEFRARCEALLFRLRHVAEMDVPFYYNFL